MVRLDYQRIKLRDQVARQVSSDLPAHIGWVLGEDGALTVVQFVDLDAEAQRDRLRRLALERRAVAVLHSVEFWFTALHRKDPRAKEADRAWRRGQLGQLSYRREGVRIYAESLTLDPTVEQAEILRTPDGATLTPWESLGVTLPYDGFRRYLPPLRARFSGQPAHA